MLIGTVLAITMAIMRRSVSSVALGGDDLHPLVLPGHAYLHAADLLVAAATLYPSLSFGVPFLGSMFGWEVPARYDHLLHAVRMAFLGWV